MEIGETVLIASRERWTMSSTWTEDLCLQRTDEREFMLVVSDPEDEGMFDSQNYNPVLVSFGDVESQHVKEWLENVVDWSDADIIASIKENIYQATDGSD